MRFCGIDLAAESKFTGLATLSLDGSRVVVEDLTVGNTDEELIHAIASTQGAGVDVPLGWPTTFVNFIQQHAAQTLEAPENTASAWRRTLALRSTDIDLHRRSGLTPLSVSANLIAYPAFRWAGIEAHLRDRDIDVSRDGSGRIAEVYPAAALYRWGIGHIGYKGPNQQTKRAVIIAQLAERFPDLEWNNFEDEALSNDDALDALIAALVCYQIHLGEAEGPPEHLREIAHSEGWIWVPKVTG